jgi:hypothetical protein
MKSLNATFSGDSVGDNEYPKGAQILRLLSTGLENKGWDSSHLENWRDCGWSLSCVKAENKVEIVLAEMDAAWMMQIGPKLNPGLLGKFLKKRPSATSASCFEIGTIAHQEFQEKGFFDFKWKWDGRPNDKSDKEPRSIN